MHFLHFCIMTASPRGWASRRGFLGETLNLSIWTFAL